MGLTTIIILAIIIGLTITITKIRNENKIKKILSFVCGILIGIFPILISIFYFVLVFSQKRMGGGGAIVYFYVLFLFPGLIGVSLIIALISSFVTKKSNILFSYIVTCTMTFWIALICIKLLIGPK